MAIVLDRRGCITLVGTTLLGASTGCSVLGAVGIDASAAKEVPAVEDLMREHGVLRRALLVYAEAADRLSSSSEALPLTELGRTATLFRRFGEDYHERLLEEQFIFPTLFAAGGRNAEIARTLAAQHERGREISAYISTAVSDGKSRGARAESLGATLRSFVRMYEHHAAIEDTIVFPAWKRAISASQYSELTERFEDLEHEMFGTDGYEDAVAQIGEIERAFGLADLAALTAPRPPEPT
jgi:hemerythrin-like domain-containing protein